MPLEREDSELEARIGEGKVTFRGMEAQTWKAMRMEIEQIEHDRNSPPPARHSPHLFAPWDSWKEAGEIQQEKSEAFLRLWNAYCACPDIPLAELLSPRLDGVLPPLWYILTFLGESDAYGAAVMARLKSECPDFSAVVTEASAE